MGGTRITAQGLAHVQSPPHLRKISVFDTPMGDAAIQHIERPTRLAQLLSGKSKATIAGTVALPKALSRSRCTE